MKLPDLKKATLKKPELRGDVKSPQFLADLYADLRDRHLLPLVALLLVGIVAAPFLLNGGGEEEESYVGGPVTTEEEQAAASFAVVPSDPGLRDYKRRLGHRDPRNPFAQPAPQNEGGGGGGGGAVGGGDQDSLSVTGGSVGPPPSGFGGSPETTSTTTQTTTVTQVVAESTVTGHEIEISAGFLGDIKVKAGIEPMTTLPSDKNPVLTFVGLSKDEKGAIFLMDSNVTAYYGKAKCVIDELACTTVEVRPGQSATFSYGYGDTRYKLTLKRIYPIVERSADADTVTATKRFSK